MIKRFKMLMLEAKIRIYGIMFEHYKCKAIRYEYYVKMTNIYTDKIYNATEDFKKACSDYRVSQLEAIIKELRSALLANTKGVAVACDFLEKYAAWLEKRT